MSNSCAWINSQRCHAIRLKSGALRRRSPRKAERRFRRQCAPAADCGGPLKNRSAYRAIPVGSVVTDALAAHLAAYPAVAADFVFRAEAGDPLHRGLFGETWKVARRTAGLPTAGMHDLRRFYATAPIRAGLSVKVVSERLGHTNAAMTLNVYSHFWPDDEDRTRQAIDDVFAPRVPRTCPAEDL